MTRTPGQILPGSKWPSVKGTLSGDCGGKEDTKKQEKDEGCFQLSPQMYRPVHTTRPGLLEAWLVLPSVKYHGNLYNLIPLNQ